MKRDTNRVGVAFFGLSFFFLLSSFFPFSFFLSLGEDCGGTSHEIYMRNVFFPAVFEFYFLLPNMSLKICQKELLLSKKLTFT